MHDPKRSRAHPSLRGRGPLIALLAIVAVVAAACGGGASPSPSAGSTLPSLEGTTWRAVLVRDTAPLADAPPTIRFEGGQAGGTTGCNTYGGAYQVAADGTFKIDSMIMTEMACDGPRGTQEGAVIEILTAADRIELIDGQLKISGSAGSLTFAEDPR
jgi:heat shock protein HslJ